MNALLRSIPIIAFFAIASCNTPHCTDYEMFKRYKDNSLSNFVFFGKPVQINLKHGPVCGYDLKLKYWELASPSNRFYQPDYVVDFQIYNRSDSIFVHNQYSGKDIYLFRIGDTINNIGVIEMNYRLTNHRDTNDVIWEFNRLNYIVEKAFYDKKCASNTYRIRLKNYPYFSFFSDGEDLVFYLSLEYGILGAYLCNNVQKPGEPLSTDIISSWLGYLVIDKFGHQMEFVNGGYE